MDGGACILGTLLNVRGWVEVIVLKLTNRTSTSKLDFSVVEGKEGEPGIAQWMLGDIGSYVYG